MNPYSQWLFLITDSTDPAIFLPNVDDGQNISFLYNISDFDTSVNTSSPAERVNDLQCFTSNLLQVYVKALHQVIREEETHYFQTTEDDWSRSKPSAGDRRNNIYRTLQVLNIFLHISRPRFQLSNGLNRDFVLLEHLERYG